MSFEGPQARPITSWGSAVSNLKSAASHCNSQSSLLFNRLDAAIEDEIDFSLEDALVRIDEELAGILHVQNQLQQTITRMQNYRNSSKKLVPIHRIPEEILLYIISLGVEDDLEMERQHRLYLEMEEIQKWKDYDSLPLSFMETPDAEWRELDRIPENHPDYALFNYVKPEYYLPDVCSQVCRKWRNLTLQKASFWTQLTLGMRTEHVEKMLCRSKLLPINVVMKGLEESSDSDVLALSQLSIISQHTSRIASFEITLTNGYKLELILSDIIPNTEGSPYCLHRLAIRMEESEGVLVGRRHLMIKLDGRDLSIPEGLLYSIREIDFSGTSLPWYSKAFQNLTSLRLDSIVHPSILPTSDGLYSVLSESPDLQSLELISFYVSDIEYGLFRPRIHLTQLHTFKFKQYPRNSDRLAFESFLFFVLWTPNLVRLSMEWLGDIDASLTRFISRPDRSVEVGKTSALPKVEYLRISDCQISKPTMHEIFHEMPNIKDLGIRNLVKYGNYLLEILTFQPDILLLKKLEIIRLTRCHRIRSFQRFKDMITSRKQHHGCPPGSEIQKLAIKWCGFEVDHSRRIWLEDNVATVVFKNYPPEWRRYSSEDEEFDSGNGDSDDYVDSDDSGWE